MFVDTSLSVFSRFTFQRPINVSYAHQFSVHEKPREDPKLKSTRWHEIVTHVARCSKMCGVAPEKLVLSTHSLCLSHGSTDVLS